jgi:hypothetical protein
VDSIDEALRGSEISSRLNEPVSRLLEDQVKEGSAKESAILRASMPAHLYSQTLPACEMGFFALMISPPSTWTDAHDLMEGAGERRLIRKACLFRDISQCVVRLHQELLGPLNPALHEPSVSRHTEAGLE